MISESQERSKQCGKKKGQILFELEDGLSGNMGVKTSEALVSVVSSQTIMRESYRWF